jgi:methionine--tRNA ligase beta chain
MKAKAVIPFGDFEKLDMRVGTIVEVEIPDGSEHVYRMRVNLGKDVGERTIFSGLKADYDKEDLVGKQALFAVNLEPKKIMGEESEGMLLAVDGDDMPILLVPEKPVEDGVEIK